MTRAAPYVVLATLARRRRGSEELLREAAVFRLVALGFSAPRLNGFADMRRALLDACKDEIIAAHGAPVGRTLHMARAAWFAVAPNELCRDYLRLFMGTAAVSLHETAYGDGRRIGGRPVELADIGGFYSAFGFAMRDSDPVLSDHLCAECEFFSLLAIKEAYALISGRVADWRTTRAAADEFLEQHLGRWPKALLAELRRQGAPSAFVVLARLLVVLVETRRSARGLRSAVADMRHSEPEPEGDEWVCPMAEAGKDTIAPDPKAFQDFQYRDEVFR
jgi:TorA maturation chaperone TorD